MRCIMILIMQRIHTGSDTYKLPDIYFFTMKVLTASDMPARSGTWTPDGQAV